MIWANLYHLGYNAYSDRDDAGWFSQTGNQDLGYRPFLRFDDDLWEELTQRIQAIGGNLIVLSIADGLRFDSHPEIAVEGAWSPARLKAEIARLATMGIELIPKLNFSTSHDLWLGPYHRMISTPIYYEVCHNLITELCDIFDTPRFFHLGFDEETLEMQAHYEYVTLRQHDLWWRDLQFFVDEVERAGSRPWIWSDFIWNHPDEFQKRMSRSVVHSNWYYGETFDVEIDTNGAKRVDGCLDDSPSGLGRRQTTPLGAYRELEHGGYDQIPTGSSYVSDNNFPETVKWCRANLCHQQLLGFLQTVWLPVTEKYRDRHELGLKKFAEGRNVW